MKFGLGFKGLGRRAVGLWVQDSSLLGSEPEDFWSSGVG